MVSFLVQLADKTNETKQNKQAYEQPPSPQTNMRTHALGVHVGLCL